MGEGFLKLMQFCIYATQEQAHNRTTLAQTHKEKNTRRKHKRRKHTDTSTQRAPNTNKHKHKTIKETHTQKTLSYNTHTYLT